MAAGEYDMAMRELNRSVVGMGGLHDLPLTTPGEDHDTELAKQQLDILAERLYELTKVGS